MAVVCEAASVIPIAIRLRWQNFSGVHHALELPLHPSELSASCREKGVALSAQLERAGGETIVRAQVSNLGDAPIAIGSATIEVATGLDAQRPARFFKHGYQSWSASRAAAVGDSGADRDNAPELVRLCFRSEVERPSDSPEAATSELFTVIESDGVAERMLAGFIATAAQLSVIAVSSPDRIHARAMLDGVALAPGAHRDVEPLLLIHASEPAARLAERWASKTGHAMNARVGAKYQRGWCSWYHYFHGITEEALRVNIKALAAMRAEFPLELIQLDDGFQSALGDWDTTNAKFPSGLERIAGEICAAGFEAGIWTAPFFASRDSQIMSAHPDWFIRDRNGDPLKVSYNTNWTTHQDAHAYALDPSNPAFADHLSALYDKLVRRFGYSYLKLDFLYAAAAEGVRHDRTVTRAQTLRRGLEAIRRAAGEDTFILGCGCPLGPAIGIVDGMRIGPDVSPGWRTGTVQAIDAITARSFMHRRLWLNDPDCLMLRERETSLNAEERGALAASIAISGGMLLLSDDMRLLGPAQAALYKSVAKIGSEVDARSADEPPLEVDLARKGPVRIVRKELSDGALVMALNRGDEAGHVALAELQLGSGDAHLVSLDGGENDAPAVIELPPHSARILRNRRPAS